MRLLEVVRGAKTSKPVIATAMQIAKKIGKVAALVGVCHGFVGNRSVSCVAPDTMKLTVRSDIKKPEDFVGKKIGSALGSVSDYCFDKYFEKNKVDKSKVTYLNVAAPESVPLLDKGDISGFFYWEPWPTKAVEVSGSKVHILGSSAQLGVYAAKLFIAVPRTYTEKNPRMV